MRDVQEFGDHRGKPLMGRVGEAGPVLAHRPARGGVGGGQAVTVDLADARMPRHGVQGHHRRGDHVGRQPAGERRPDLLGPCRCAVGGDIGGQPRRARVAVCDDRCLVDVRQVAEGVLDLAELDAVAADLHLPVQAALELDGAVLAQVDQVPGPVQARARLAAERIGHEALGGEGGAARVPPGEPGAADQQLAVTARGHPAHVLVDHVGPYVRDRLTDGHGRAVARAVGRVRGGVDRGLGGSVHVVERDAGQRLAAPQDEFVAQYLAAGEDPPHRGPVELPGVEQGGDHLRGEVDRLDPMGEQQVPQLESGRGQVRRCHDHGAAARQWGVQVDHRRVERRGDALQESDRVTGQKLGGDPAHLVDDRLVGHHHPLRDAGGPRGVDQVRERTGQRVAGAPAGGSGVRQRLVLVHADHGRCAEALGEALPGHHEPCPGVREHEGGPVGRREQRIDRQVRGPGLENAEHRDDQVQRPFQAQADDVLPAYALPAQPVGQPVGTLLQFPVGQLLLVADDGDGVGRAIGLALEEFVQTAGGGAFVGHRDIPFSRERGASGARSISVMIWA